MPTTKKKEEQNQLEVQDVSKQNSTQQNGYQSQWQPQISSAVNDYLNRDPFQYNVNEDALFQQMKDMYVLQGQRAMMDTMGQSAAMTGGYGNSWSQGAGQQAYQGYMQQLNDSIPDLYQMALNQYMNEGNVMAQNIGMMMDQDALDYGRYRDQMADQEDAYNKLVALMENYDYIPTAEEMAAAGMPESHMQAIMRDYLATLQGGGDGGYYYSGNPNPGGNTTDYDLTEEMLANGGYSSGQMLQIIRSSPLTEGEKNELEEKYQKPQAKKEVNAQNHKKDTSAYWSSK